MTQRAGRRYRIYLSVLFAGVAAAVVLGVVAGSGDTENGDWWMLAAILIGLLAFCGGVLALAAWAMRRRGAGMVSPLWGTDRRARERIGRAIRKQEPLSGEEHRLAVAEAQRTRKISPVVTVVMVLSVSFMLVGTGLQIAGGTSLARFALSLMSLLSLTGIFVYQLLIRRWAVAYLQKFGDDPA